MEIRFNRVRGLVHVTLVIIYYSAAYAQSDLTTHLCTLPFYSVIQRTKITDELYNLKHKLSTWTIMTALIAVSDSVTPSFLGKSNASNTALCTHCKLNYCRRLTSNNAINTLNLLLIFFSWNTFAHLYLYKNTSHNRWR